MNKSFGTILVLFYFANALHAQGTLLDEAPKRGPAVAAILELPRGTPAQQLRGIFTLIDLGETDVAAELWKAFAKQKPNTKTQVALVEKFGTARFLTLSRQDSQLFAGAREFVATCLETKAQQSRNPQRIARMVNQLNDPAARQRHAARVDLAATSTQGAVACLEALAQAKEDSARTNIMLALVEMRPEVDPLIIAMLADSHGQVRRDVAELAGYLQLSESIPWLAAMVAGAEPNPNVVAAAQSALTKLNLSMPTIDEVRELIRNELHRLQLGVLTNSRPPRDIDFWWIYDSLDGKLQSQNQPAEARKILAAARLSRLLLQLPAPPAEDRQSALIYAYQAARELEQNPTAEVQQWVAELDTSTLNEALDEALRNNSLAAAQAFAELLGKQSDQAAIASIQNRPAPLVRALTHTDQSLRYAALQAIMQIAPQRNFSGASGLPKALWHFVAATGTPQVVTGAATTARANLWAGQLRGLGFAATPTTNGRDTIHTAIRSPRLQLVLLDSDINRPLLREVVFQLRTSPHTGQIPIAILSSPENLDRAQSLARHDQWLLALPPPHQADDMQSMGDQLTELSHYDSAEERLEQAQQALVWIAHLLESGHPYDELLREADMLNHAVYQPELTTEVLRVLPLLGTAASQQLLVNLASTQAQPIEMRQQAATGLATSVKQFGKLLTSHQILRQYDRYNASETADADTQDVLGQVLDILAAQSLRNLIKGRFQSPDTDYASF